MCNKRTETWKFLLKKLRVYSRPKHVEWDFFGAKNSNFLAKKKKEVFLGLSTIFNSQTETVYSTYVTNRKRRNINFHVKFEIGFTAGYYKIGKFLWFVAVFPSIRNFAFIFFRCGDALQKNKHLIQQDQRAYQKELERNYIKLTEKLEPLLKNKFGSLRGSMRQK